MAEIKAPLSEQIEELSARVASLGRALERLVEEAAKTDQALVHLAEVGADRPEPLWEEPRVTPDGLDEVMATWRLEPSAEEPSLGRKRSAAEALYPRGSRG